MLGTGATRVPTYATERPSYTVAPSNQRSLITKGHDGERIIPIETTTSSQYRV